MWWEVRTRLVNIGIARTSLEVPSVLFEPGTDLYGYVSDITFWEIEQISFKYISVWWRRIYSLSLTPFSETYELKGYIVEVISDISHFGNVTCWVMLKWSLCWLFVIGSFIWSSILVIISMIICWPKAWLLYKVCFCGRDFVEPHTPWMVKTGKKQQGYEG